jgi:hypothetical protein
VNEVIYWGRPLDWKNQTLTPNPDTLYFMTFLNTKDVGPIAIEVPPAEGGGSLNANFVNISSICAEHGPPRGGQSCTARAGGCLHVRQMSVLKS